MPTNKVNFPQNFLTSKDILSLMKLKIKIEERKIEF